MGEKCEKDMIQFTNLKVWTPEEKSWWKKKVTKPKMMILNDGSIKADDFVGILGPSGAGKTTFLSSLAGKCTLPSEGVVTVKGASVTELQRVVEMVPQTEVFMPSLSVMEHLAFMTEMKLGSCNKPEKKQVLKELLYELKLDDLVNTEIRALSGGERRLLSLASSLISNPDILICDEPTTGLDSYNAALVISVLKKIAASGKVVICSVHQPSSVLFKEFSSIMLMADGRLLLHGTQDECEAVFESLNLHCPVNYNPAEFYIKAISNSNSDQSPAHKIKETYDRLLEKRDWDCGVTLWSDSEVRSHKITRRSWFKQVQLLLWRSSLSLSKTIRVLFFQDIFYMVLSGLIVGACYTGVSGTTQQGVQDLRGFLWLLCSQVSFALSFNTLFVFEGELPLFRREVGVYRTSAYLVVRFISLIPRCIISAASFVAVATLTVDLPNYFLTTFEFVVALVVAAVASTAYGLGIAALFTSNNVMGEVMPFTNLPLFLMSGAYMRVSSMPVWLYPVKYISHFYYTMDALSNIYWRQIDYIDCPYNSTAICVNDGVSVLIENGYSDDFIFQDTLGLCGVTLFWCLLGYYGLKREEKKGYTY